jgi:hypothetical protein
MSPREFVNATTKPATGGCIRLAPLRRRYAAEHGQMNRMTFIADLLEAGFTVVTDDVRGCLLVGRVLAPTLASVPSP